MSFSGSYRHDDVQFLLKPLPQQPFIDIAAKEELIQTGIRHYSEMLSPESLPSPIYQKVFNNAFSANRKQMAQDCLSLATLIASKRNNSITLVSLVRAGTPVGVILKHLLQKAMGREVSHYSISIIRDRGVDEVALNYILDKGHSPESIVFIDGWTGKGVISQVLKKAISIFNLHRNIEIDAGLYVLSDIAGSAAYAASSIDYLIPSSILNATVSGLVSRSLLNSSIGPSDFHGCVYYEEFKSHDISIEFVDNLIEDAMNIFKTCGLQKIEPIDREKMERISIEFLKKTMMDYGVSDVNYIKPGIGEATRVLLRRVPKMLILRDANALDVQHLIVLAKEKLVPFIVDSSLPYQAVSLIRSNLDG